MLQKKMPKMRLVFKTGSLSSLKMVQLYRIMSERHLKRVY